LALGQLTSGETLLNMTNAYSIFANGGYISKPKTYLYVTDNYGNVVLSNETAHKRVISSETSQIMTKMLQNVIKQGTGKSVRITNENIDIVGKTGTSSNNEDRWFIGYTPDYVCGIWTGFDTPKPINSSNPSCSLFNAIFEKIYDNQDETSKFLLSDIIYEEEICIESGKKANQECKKDEKSVLGYYKASDKLDYCDIHKLNFQSELKKTKKRMLWHIFS
jgi:penicillin-binding protein 1A